MIEQRYKGQGVPPDGDLKRRYPYLADKGLTDAVNMAIALRRPLLVKGPPGCGKTRLAASIAYELSLELRSWYIKSTSRARDGLYTIDVVRRLQDVYLNNLQAQRLTPYIRFGPLADALRDDKESVLLIDEIDKADIDFPNDLLRELDEKIFAIEELNDQDLTDDDRRAGWRTAYQAAQSPIVIITSNDEKELPDAFLRRCLFYYINFPGKAQLTEIVRVNTPDLDLNMRLVELAIDRLDAIRRIGDFRKQPATSELIDWVRVLHGWNVDIAALDKDKQLAELPYWQVLFKHQQDVQRLGRVGAEEAAP